MYAWEQIQKTIEFIEVHLGEEINIDCLANLAGLSPFYYQRLFRRLVKKPVAEYIKLRRLARATETLLQKDRRILDIALELGFTSHEHFTRTFKNAFKVTPDEYRKNPQTFNRMTKPELLLHYTLANEGVPLITENIVIEITKQTLAAPIPFAGLEVKMPVSFVDGLGIESGTDPLATLWNDFHARKCSEPWFNKDAPEIGVAYPCSEPEYFLYFAGSKTDAKTAPCDCAAFELSKGEYIVCTFEAENFESLVMDSLYKAQQYLYNTWLPNHKIQTEPFCAERYESHSPQTTRMELWLKIVKKGLPKLM